MFHTDNEWMNSVLKDIFFKITINKTLGIEQLKLDAHGPHRSLEQNKPLKNQIYGLIYIISRETQGVIE